MPRVTVSVGSSLGLPYLTDDVPGVGGTLRREIDDFVVDEVPAYPPAGHGDHVFVHIEKRDATTHDVVRAIARALAISERDVGTAGLKDRRAVTTQWISLPPPVTPEAALALAIDRVRVLAAARHPHKLRTGHLRGNRFRIVVRDITCSLDEALARARTIIGRLGEPPGAPNWYGEQRFGASGDNAARGRELVERGIPPGRRDRARDRLMVSAFQSELFNQWLIDRMHDGLYRVAIAGDVLHKLGGGMFDCDDPATDSVRIAAGEVVATGPMFGARMREPAAGSVAAEREAAVLARIGFDRGLFANVRAIAEGTRRDTAIAVTAPAVVSGAPGTLEMAFGLPAGAYATAIMREVMKVTS